MAVPSSSTSNERLRAAASLSAFNTPSCMTVRTTYGFDNSPTLAAIAGPMGITVVDILTPQRPWLVLNYASAMHQPAGSMRGYSDGGTRCGITTMKFQPGPSSHQNQGKEQEYHQSSNSILLATARGSGILIWDCSGRALSPLLGRLNASDAWNQVAGISQSAKEDNGDTNQNQPPVRPPVPLPSIESTPIPGSDRKSSGMSLSSASSQGTSNAAPGLITSAVDASVNNNSATSNPAIISTAPSSSAFFGSNAVTSIAWKGPSGKF
jgi:hypothetical protein